MAITPTKQWSTVGPSGWMLVNLNTFRVGCGVIANWAPVGNAAVSFNIEVTGQDPKLPNFGQIVNGLDNMTGLTASKNGSLAYPCTAVRINILTLTGAGVVSLSLVQVVN